ncbi:MAG: hypothetical protein ACRDY7_07200, partial [Acidimicrobiia bacterium]
AVVARWAGADSAGTPGETPGGAPVPPGGEVRVSPVDFRSQVNSAVKAPPGRRQSVPSARFSLAADDAARVLRVDGRGYGHGIGMSQYGAYGKARRGMRAAGILAAYYPGTKVVALPAARRPGSVRVALDEGQPQWRFSASGPFRVFDERGQAVATVGLGTWDVRPGAGADIRLGAPPEHLGVPRITDVRFEPPSPLPGQPVTLRFRLTVPATVRAVVRPPGGADTEVIPSRPAGTEPQVVKLPAAGRPGPYMVSIGTDAGRGRTSELSLMPVVLAPPDAGEPDRPWTPPGFATRLAPGAHREGGNPILAAALDPVPPRESADGRSRLGWALPAAVAAVAVGAGGLVLRRRREAFS